MDKNSELYCLKWNQFQINIFSALENLHLSEEFADVTLYCDGTSHKAHKVILSACSPYFKSVFMDHPLCTHPVIILKGVSYEDLSSLLTFMYQGEVNIQRERLPEFIRTAKLLQVRGLTNCYEINPVPKPTKTKRNEESNSEDSDASTPHGKKRIRIRRKSSTIKNTNVDNLSTEMAEKMNVDCINEANEKDNGNGNNEKDNIRHSPTPELPGGIKIKQEVTDDPPPPIMNENEGSILQRSLIGDHTVKPAESLVVTPDIPPLQSIKIEPEEAKIKIPKKYIDHREKTPSQPHKTDDTNFEDKLSTTLQLLKSNPQISVSREHLENITKKLASGSTGLQHAKKSSQYELPQISIEPMKQQQNESPILAQNLTKNQTKPQLPRCKLAIDATNTTQTESQTTASSLNTLVQLFGSGQSSNASQSSNTQANCSTGNNQAAGQSWNCPHCQQLYHNQSALKYHVRLVHSDFNNRLCCYLCPNSFTMRESYKAHMLEQHGIRH